MFAGLYPDEGGESYSQLKNALDKLTLHDRSVTLQEESHSTLGRGWRLGFLGTLHMDVFKQRLEKEFGATTIFTAPTVSYIIVYKRHYKLPRNEDKVFLTGKSEATEEEKDEGPKQLIQNMQDFPDASQAAAHVAYIKEPMILATIITPEKYIGAIMTLCLQKRGVQKSIIPLHHQTQKSLMQFEMPLAEVVIDFYDKLQSITSGYAR